MTAVSITATSAAQPFHRPKDLPRPTAVVSAMDISEYVLIFIVTVASSNERQVVAGMYALCHIQWDNTGLYDNDMLRNKHNFQPDKQITLTLIECLSLGNFRPSNVVLYNLWERENCIRLWDEFDALYQTILTRENSANSKLLAKEQYAQKIARANRQGVATVIVRRGQRSCRTYTSAGTALEGSCTGGSIS